MLTVYANTEAKVDSFMDGLRQAVSDAVDAKVEAEGGVNISILKSTLQEMKETKFCYNCRYCESCWPISLLLQRNQLAYTTIIPISKRNQKIAGLGNVAQRVIDCCGITEVQNQTIFQNVWA